MSKDNIKIDPAELLRKYMRHVIESEGWSFTESRPTHRSCVSFTDAEWDELACIAEEARK